MRDLLTTYLICNLNNASIRYHQEVCTRDPYFFPVKLSYLVFYNLIVVKIKLFRRETRDVLLHCYKPFWL